MIADSGGLESFLYVWIIMGIGYALAYALAIVYMAYQKVKGWFK